MIAKGSLSLSTTTSIKDSTVLLSPFASSPGKEYHYHHDKKKDGREVTMA